MSQLTLEVKAESFENIHLEVERPDLCNKDHPDVRGILILGKRNKVVMRASVVRNADGHYEDFVGSSCGKRNPIKYELSGGYIWGCVKGKRRVDYSDVIIDENSFTTKPTLGFFPIRVHLLTFFNFDGRYTGPIKYIGQISQEENNIAARLSREWRDEQIRISEARKLPVKVGQDIYVGTSLYLSHGADDFLGGLCKVTKVWNEGKDLWVTVAEGRGGLNWTGYLAENQAEWKKEYGRMRGRPYPDLRPEFNQWD